MRVTDRPFSAHIFEQGMIVPVSVRADDGAAVTGASRNARLSPNGSRVVFESDANDILPGDDKGESDIFVYEIATQTWVAGSHAEAARGTANGASRNPHFDADGNHIIFESQGTDLVPGFTDGNTLLDWDVFLYDLARHRMQVVSEAAGTAVSGNGSSTEGRIAADGRFAIFLRSTACGSRSTGFNDWRPRSVSSAAHPMKLRLLSVWIPVPRSPDVRELLRLVRAGSCMGGFRDRAGRATNAVGPARRNATCQGKGGIL